jgi:AbrB family looped-hinge helix DNA binding protein
MLIHMSSKGQIVIPAALRKKLGLTANTQIRVDEKDGQIILQPITREQIRRVRGILKGTAISEILLEERERERKLDEAKVARWQKM